MICLTICHNPVKRLFKLVLLKIESYEDIQYTKLLHLINYPAGSEKRGLFALFTWNILFFLDDLWFWQL